MLGCLIAFCFVTQAAGQNAAALRSRQAALADQLEHSPFQRPIAFESTQVGNTLKGEVYAVVWHPFNVVEPALQAMSNWCDILILHINVKQCRIRGSGLNGAIEVAVGRKFDQPLSDTYPVDFAYHLDANEPDYLALHFDAGAGPMGTKNYQIVFEAIPLDRKSSFLHLSYSYGFDTMARVAMQVYLATLGRNKVGFSIVDHQADGTPVYVGDMRGVVERNTMRYYLAIEAYLASLQAPLADRPERRLHDWYDASERYQKQLHELTREDYLSMKRKEIAR